MKIWNHDDFDKWNVTEKDFMIYLMNVQLKIDRIDKSMKDNVNYYKDLRIDNDEKKAYIEKLRQTFPALETVVQTLSLIDDEL